MSNKKISIAGVQSRPFFPNQSGPLTKTEIEAAFAETVAEVYAETHKGGIIPPYDDSHNLILHLGFDSVDVCGLECRLQEKYGASVDFNLSIEDANIGNLKRLFKEEINKTPIMESPQDPASASYPIL